MLVEDESQMLAIAGKLALLCQPPLVIYLCGQLGAGKTTFTRGYLSGLGYKGKVKSPTYTLVESYQFNTLNIFHFDLYRINDPEELELIGIRDYFMSNTICLIEWPEQGGGKIPSPDILCQLDISNIGRQLKFSVHSTLGEETLRRFT